MEFYIFVTVVATVTFTADMILRYMEKIRSFGMETRLHNIKGQLVPIEDFIPHNITMLSVFCMAMGTVGIILKLLSVHPFFSLPCSLAAGCIVNFAVMHLIVPFARKIAGEYLPENEDISEMEAVCTEKIPADDYGRIELEYKKRSYYFDAVSENETDIEKGERVYILYREENLCVVEKTTEILDVLNEKPEKPSDKKQTSDDTES